MKRQDIFDPDGERYKYDFGICSVGNGFAQVDTRQDASYFGTWANPSSLTVVCYCEGDVSIETTDDPREFVETIYEIAKRDSFEGIDPMMNKGIEAGFRALGLGGLLH